jgi:uncharacterized protein (DUF58 family)
VHPVLGHVLSGGGPLNILLILLGACVGLGGVRLRDRKPAAATWGKSLMVLGIALFGLGLVIDASPGPTTSNASVRIVRPSAGQEVPAGQPVEVAVDLKNGTIALSPSSSTGGHLHLYVDGQLQQMPSTTEVEVTLEPGEHEIRVEYVDAQHLSFSPEVTNSIEVRAT